MIACALIPRLSLIAALGDGRREMVGRPVALAPEPGGPQVIGEASGAAEAFGLRAGMRLSEALARCPALVLLAPDPGRAEAIWEESLRRLEAIGAAVETGWPGGAFFAVEPLRGLYGGPAAVLARARRALDSPARIGAGPSRLSAFAAASRARPRRRPPIVAEDAAGALLARLPVGALRDFLPGEWERLELPETLERLGVRTLGELASLPPTAVADRFGEPGLRALRMARGIEEPLRPRRPPQELVERIELPEAASGTQLEHAVELLVERLLAAPARRGRSVRRLRLEARLAAGGGWRVEVALRSASADPERLCLVLAPKLERLPGPASELGLRAVELGQKAHDQGSLARSRAQLRRGRLGEAVRQARTAAGRDAVLRVVEVDPSSRVPERRALLTPFPEPGGELS
jgi:protein ImuB